MDWEAGGDSVASRFYLRVTRWASTFSESVESGPMTARIRGVRWKPAPEGR